MTDKDGKKHAATERETQFAAAALDRLKALGLAPLPDYYTVFFAYYEGARADLVQAVDAALRTTQGDRARTQDYLARIHESFFGMGRRQELLETAAENIDAEFNRLIGMIDEANQTSRTYGDALGRFSTKLQDTTQGDQIRTATNAMAGETQTAIDKNKILQGELDSALAQVSELRQNLDSVKRETLVDALTAIGNRKAFMTGFATLTQEAIQRKESLSLIMVDIDFFKKFNDTYGHRIGDQILKLVARTLKDNVKGRDVVCRYGGEEFVLLLPRTGFADAIKVAENLRRMMASKRIVRRDDNSDLGTVTLSLGVTEFIRGEDEASLVGRADEALYAAKAKGRNCVVAAEPPVASDVVGDHEAHAASGRHYADEVIEIESPPPGPAPHKA